MEEEKKEEQLTPEQEKEAQEALQSDDVDADKERVNNPEGKKRLTIKQRKWLKLYIETGNATQSAIEAYGLDPKKQYGVATVIGSENIRKLSLPLDELMDEAGLTDTYLLMKMNESLNATKLYGKNAIEHPDHPSRVRTQEMAWKLKNKLKDKLEVEGELTMRDLVGLKHGSDTNKGRSKDSS